MDTTTHAIPITVPGLDFDPRPLFSAAAATAAEVIGAIHPDQLTNETPCTQFDVRRLLAHLVGVCSRVAAIGRGDDWSSVTVSVDGVADDQWAATWRSEADVATAAWADAVSLERIVVLPWATDTGGAALLGYVSEITVHSWDLARATGQRPVWNDEVAERSYQLMRRWLPGENRAEIFAAVRKNMGANTSGDDAFAEVVPVADDAPAIDRLVAWNGRRP